MSSCHRNCLRVMTSPSCRWSTDQLCDLAAEKEKKTDSKLFHFRDPFHNESVDFMIQDVRPVKPTVKVESESLY